MRSLCFIAVIAFLALAGCGQSGPSGELARQGQEFLLPAEPAGAVGILDYREAAGDLKTGEAASAGSDVVLWGKVGGAAQTWSPLSAEFFISDPTCELEAGGHVCHDDNCPFCKNKQHKNQDGLAVVVLTDPAGNVPAVDARKLLPLEKGQMIVVRGQAEIDSTGQLLVRASGVYLRR
jgi:hypothetical protein